MEFCRNLLILEMIKMHYLKLFGVLNYELCKKELIKSLYGKKNMMFIKEH